MLSTKLSMRMLQAALPLLGAVTAPAQVAADTDAGAPVLFAHYYTWYDANTWTSGATSDLPSETYASSENGAMTRQIEQAQSAGIDVFNVAWLGPNNPTDRNFSQMLPIAAAHGFGLTIGVETDSPFIHSRSDLATALSYAISTYARQPGYFSSAGRPVLFFWRPPGIPLDGAASPIEAWRQLRDAVDPDHQTLWIGEGDAFEYLQVFDGIHAYSVAWAPNVARTLSIYGQRTRQEASALSTPKLWVAAVMPGYDDTHTGRSDAFARDRQGTGFYDETWQAALASSPDWVIITSWNEWIEGSQIEPSRTYGNAYLDVTRSYVAEWKGLAATDSSDAADAP